MKEFLDKTVSKINDYQAVKFPVSYKASIQRITCELFGVNTFFELNDMFDGTAFYKKYSNEIFGYLSAIKVLHGIFMDLDDIDHKKNYLPSIKYKNQEIKIRTSDFGVFPLIETEKPSPTIIVFRKDELIYWLAGIVSKNTMTEYFQAYSKYKIAWQTKKIPFYDLEKIKPFESFSDLDSIL